jgi:hypothetical protein
MNLPTAFLSLALASLAATAAETNNAPTTPSRDGGPRGQEPRRGFGGPIVLNDDDKPAFANAPAGFKPVSQQMSLNPFVAARPEGLSPMANIDIYCQGLEILRSHHRTFETIRSERA